MLINECLAIVLVATVFLVGVFVDYQEVNDQALTVWCTLMCPKCITPSAVHVLLLHVFWNVFAQHALLQIVVRNL